MGSMGVGVDRVGGRLQPKPISGFAAAIDAIILPFKRIINVFDFSPKRIRGRGVAVEYIECSPMLLLPHALLHCCFVAHQRYPKTA